MQEWWLPIGVVSAALAVSVFFWLRRRPARRPTPPLAEARKSFRQRREWLEARFETLASQSGKPRDLRWVECRFDDQVAFARDRRSGELRALVALTIAFEAIEGGALEHEEAVRNLRAATAVFHYRDGEWSADGRAFFNLNPNQTIEHYHNELELIFEPAQN
ncbi:MAG: hypothetical protein QGG36_01390 [Pirellulaceae bacterium]|jgi:hypothetical protein|nr:hypothetical protein [Pirellulaceae bacterium]MDP7014432.1 hypothetical protein [Pirellulaceae bacterium]